MSEPHIQNRYLTQNWQQQLASGFTQIDRLCRYLEVNVDDLPVSSEAAKNFPLRVPQSFADCMEKGNPKDPLLRQVLPIQDELLAYPGFNNDPVGDLAATPQTGVLHKYQGRVLLINTGSCAINCRYCFRRNFPYADLQLGKQDEDQAIRYIRADPSIKEVILSGGDPLLLSDERLAQLFDKIAFIPHVTRIRIHSRMPIVLPARITPALLKLLGDSPKQTSMVVHCNHPQEISKAVAKACQALKASCAGLFNQSVLLKGVNADAHILSALSEQLFESGIIPYYLHLLDKANGTGHFEVSEDKALAIMTELKASLPGYLVPKLVKEQAGATSKQWVL